MNIDICVCTYRRPHVAQTLLSLAKLTLKPDWQIRVIVADNDETPSACELVENTARENSLTLSYIHAPARNISIARNACLDAATAPLIAFIDDDEIADPDWLSALVSAQEIRNADIVLGPVRAVYAPEASDWMIEGDFHSINPVWVQGKIITGYSCNVLIRREAPALKNLRFRKEFGRSGGEDTVFFAAAHRAGALIAFAPDAIVTEAVPTERASLQWLLKRRFRTGQTHALLLLEREGTNALTRAKNAAIASAKALFCFIMVAPNLWRKSRAYFWLLRGAMHAGVVARLSGVAEAEHYG